MRRMPPPPKGVMGITPAVTGSIEATEVLKITVDLAKYYQVNYGLLTCAHCNLTNFHYKRWFLK